MTSAGLKKLVTKWRKALRLEDWSFDVRWKTDEDTEISESLGACYYSPEYKSAIIVLASQEEHEAHGEELEHTVIHELLHVRIHGHKTYKAKDYDSTFEFNLNEISSILLENLKHRRK